MPAVALTMYSYDNYNNFPKVVCELWRKYDRPGFNEIERKQQNLEVDIATDSEARRIRRADNKNDTNFYQQIRNINTCCVKII